MPKRHEVREGECISSIAYDHGFFPDTLWDHAENAELKRRREDMNVLLPGDEVFIPDKRLKEAERPTGALHRFRRKGVPQRLRVQFLRVNKPIADRPYKIDVDGRVTEGRTDAKGWLTEDIVPNARQATVTLERGPTYHIRLGHLEPIDEVAGVQSRLANLGFYRGEINNTLDAATEEAVRAYQRLRGFEPTGAIDDRLKAALKEAVSS